MGGPARARLGHQRRAAEFVADDSPAAPCSSTICSGTALQCVQVNTAATVSVCDSRPPCGLPVARRVFRRQSRAVEIRTVAGPLSAVQCVLSGGPYAV